MGSLDFAVSIHSLVTTVGNYAGLAAIVGLAILVLLHFAQARESATLRDRADEAEQRVGELEARLGHLARQQPAPSPQAAVAQGGPQTASAQAATAAPVRARAVGVGAAAAPVPAGVAAASFPWAPAGVGAPALTAATTLIPVWKPSEESRPPAVPDGPVNPAGEMTEVQRPEPAVVGAATNGGSHARTAPPPVGAPAAAATAAAPSSAVRPPAAGRPAGPGSRPAGPGSRPAGPSGRPGTSAPRFLPPQPEPPPRRTGRVIAVLLALGLAVVAIAIVLVVTKTIGGSSTSNPPGPAASGGGQARAVVFNPRSVTVAVLNGTATPGLAGRTSKQLMTDGYKPGTVATASDQTQPTTTVAYLPGYRADAIHVASVLKLPDTSVHQVSSSAQAVACPPPSPCSANVVVTVGADLPHP